MDNSEDELVDLAAQHQPSFEVSTIVYRRATATNRRAQRVAAEHAETGSTERRLREIDAVIETIVLVQAACESWIYYAYRHTDVEPGEDRGWIQRWIQAPRLICDRDRNEDQSPARLLNDSTSAGVRDEVAELAGDYGRTHDRAPTRALDDATVANLRRISAWRNWLVHNDDRSRDTLRKAIGKEPDVQLLTAALAEQVLAWADQAFADLGSLIRVHGLSGLSSDHLWIGYDEQ